MTDVIVKDNIENLIYEIRGKQVMLDSDLAKLYQCKNGTKEINQAVKNDINKFPERFSWVLTVEESKNFLVKILTKKLKLEVVDIRILEYLQNKVWLCFLPY